jgi:dephospho-CoA kinase
MISFKQFIAESVNDKGIMKAIFIIGLPGAGKSYTVKQLSGSISPKVVNTDRATEYLAKKYKKTSTSKNWNEFKDSAHRITNNTLLNYLDSMLPLFIDGTSNDVSNILNRIGILESIGYDIGVIFVHTDIDTAIARAKSRTGRDVDEDFIHTVDKKNLENAEYLKAKVNFFKQIDNTTDGLDDAVMQKAFKAVQGFYNEPISNPVGKRTLEELQEKKAKYLVPDVFTKEALDKKISSWYRS